MKDKIKKKFFCYPDILFNELIPQKLQMSVMIDYALKINRVIDFYTGENHKTYKDLGLFVKKLNSKPPIDGFIFFSFFQFCYSGKANINLVEKAIKKGYTICFVRENIFIENIKKFRLIKKDLFFFTVTNMGTLSHLLNGAKRFS